MDETRPRSGRAVKTEEVRDLRDQISDIKSSDLREIVLEESSPPRYRHPVYSMLSGEEVLVAEKRLEAVLSQKLPDGRYAFTANPEQAPSYKRNQIKCVFHPESSERQTLDEIGLAGVICHSAHLASMFSRRIHAENRHPSSWRAYQEWLSEQKEQATAARQEKQIEATLALAGNVAPARTEPCGCGWQVPSGSKNPTSSMGMHKRLHCPLREKNDDNGTGSTEGPWARSGSA